MNKENIERIDKHADYDFSILNKQGIKEVEKLKEKNPLFEKDRIVNTKYDSWLNVLNLDHPTIDYMYNVRNGLLHSEYDFYDEYGNTIYVKNSNYTKFEGKILLTSFIDFALFYFGNSVWSGLSENTKLYNVVTDGQIKTEKELQNVLDQLQIVTIDYKLKKDNSTNVSPENKLYNLAKKGLITDYNYQKELDRLYRNNAKDHVVTTNGLNEDEKIIIKKMLETYYGNELYDLDEKSQVTAVVGCITYYKSPRSTISEWITDFIKTLNFIEKLEYKRIGSRMTPKEYYEEVRPIIEEEMEVEENKRSVFACRTSLLMMKAYHILYRLQNKAFEDIDYNYINFDFTSGDYTYTKTDINGIVTINNFTDDIQKIMSKYPTLSGVEAQNMAVSEIIRNALSHGNMDIEFKIDANNNLREYIVLDDIYHSKSRKLVMSLDKFEEYLLSEAFTSKYSKNKTLVKTITK